MPGAPAPQGVILVVADTLRKDHLNFHGYERETAPFLARLGREGAIFRDNVAQATWTKVSVPSILTGMYPLAHRVADMRDRLPAAAVTLAEAYREAGYATVSYSSVPSAASSPTCIKGSKNCTRGAPSKNPEARPPERMSIV